MLTGMAQSHVRGHPILGRWRIVEMSMWEVDSIDLVGPGLIEFAGGGDGQLRFIAVEAQIAHRPSDAPGHDVEFTFAGFDEGDEVSGRGWATLTEERIVAGHIYFHQGDDSAFRAEPFPGSR